jgi:NhaP-type Na+/H+ and K+/H+ antiporter
MPLAGGPTDKIGNRYEGRWTVQCMIDVLEDKARSIQLEKAGEDGFEFILRRESQSYYHQVKRQNSRLGHWTIGSLENNQTQVLSNFWEKLSNQNSICVFVSTQDADQLGELAQRSKDSSSFQEFKDCFLTQKLSSYLDTLRKKWSNCGEEDAYKALKQIQVETVGENFLKSTVESRLSALFDDNPTTVRLELIELSLEKIHQELSTYEPIPLIYYRE